MSLSAHTSNFYCNPIGHGIGFFGARTTSDTVRRVWEPDLGCHVRGGVRFLSTANGEVGKRFEKKKANDLSNTNGSSHKPQSLAESQPVNENQKQVGLMFENTGRIDLAKIEKLFERSFANVELLGQLKFTIEDYRQINRIARETLNKKASNLEKIPDRVFLALMVFCARFEDISVSGFWSVFLEGLELRNDSGTQNACRKRFHEMQDNLEQLYFPAEGYTCVTPILYHTVIPQVCVPEMARLLRELGQNAGWDAVTELEAEELEAQLPIAVSKMRTTKTLSRFVNNPHSRRLAAQFVHDLCEAAYLHQRGVFRLHDIESLLEDHPVQREVWDKLMEVSADYIGGTTITRALIVSPRWQWDLRARQMRLFFPQQNISGENRPAFYVTRKERYPVEAQQGDGCWRIEPICLAGGFVQGQDAETFRVELRAEDDRCLRHWDVNPLSGRVLFFQPGAAGTVASFVPHERGLAAGEWLVLIRQNLYLRDSEGDVKAKRQWYAPRGFEEYRAISVFLEPPVTVFASDDHDEPLTRIAVADESSKSLQLEGQVLLEADDPSGTATFSGLAPDVLIAARSWEELRNLQVQLRELTATSDNESVAQIYSIQSLRQAEIAVWSETKNQLTIQLSNLLPEGAVGRFRLKLLRGLQSAQYLPLEFNLVPAIRITPSAEEFIHTLYTAEQTPQVQTICSARHQVISKSGNVANVVPGINQIDWSVVENDYEATLKFGHFSLPLRWHPHILRSRITSKGSPTSWAPKTLSLALDSLSFAYIMNIEGIPEASYKIYAGEVLVTSGRFNAQASLQFPLAHLTDFVKRSAAKQAPVRIIVSFGQREHQLLLLAVHKRAAGENELASGEPIRYLRVGQQVLHPDYGLGALEAFVETEACGNSISAARFQFDRYGGVNFFIPVTSRLPVYGYRQIFSSNTTASAARVRQFVVGEKTKECFQLKRH